MRYYLIVGEASGDLHASNLMRALLKQDPDAEFRYYGGDCMQQVGGCLVRHYRQTAIMGFVRVLLHARQLLSLLDECKRDIVQYAPDRLILVDYPGFNLRIAKYIHTHTQIPVDYYIPPKIWAWKENRVRKIRKYIDRVHAIFPFEPAFYARHGVEAGYVGNPTVESVKGAKTLSRAQLCELYNLDASKRLVLLLPGSRKQEVEQTLRVFLQMHLAEFSDCQFVVAGTSAVDPQTYRLAHEGGLKLVMDATYLLMQHADAAIVNSGTATLETALFKVPQVVVYPAGIPPLLYAFGRRFLMKLPSVSLVNIVAEHEVVCELINHHYTPDKVHYELSRLLSDEAYRQTLLQGYDQVAKKLGNQVASATAAQQIFASLAR